MASSSDPYAPNRDAPVRKHNKGPPFKFLVPLVYAPVLPLIRISLRHRPVLRDRLFTAVLAGAFAHGFYLVHPPVFREDCKGGLAARVFASSNSLNLLVPDAVNVQPSPHT